LGDEASSSLPLVSETSRCPHLLSWFLSTSPGVAPYPTWVSSFTLCWPAGSIIRLITAWHQMEMPDQSRPRRFTVRSNVSSDVGLQEVQVRSQKFGPIPLLVHAIKLLCPLVKNCPTLPWMYYS